MTLYRKKFNSREEAEAELKRLSKLGYTKAMIVERSKNEV